MGDPKDLPAPKQWPSDDGWQLAKQFGAPDFVVKSEPYTMPSHGQDVWFKPLTDIGFSALLLDSEKANRRSHNPFRNFENIWATLEVFNLIDRANTISYMLVKDFANTTYAIPQRLTPRLLNLKLVGRF